MTKKGCGPRYAVLARPLADDEDLLDAEWIEVEGLTLDEIIDLICAEGRYPHVR